MIFVDFEYALPSEPGMGLVSCSAHDGAEIRSWWLADPEQKEDCQQFFLDRQGETIVAYAVELAEGRAMQALFHDDPICFGTITAMNWKWIDLMLCWRWCRNQDDAWAYGPIISGNRFFPTIKTSVPPPRGSRAGKKATKAEREEAARLATEWAESQGAESAASANGSLLDALVFFGCLTEGELRDAKHQKDAVREAIIKSRGIGLEPLRDEIIKYNEQDVAKLQMLWGKMREAMESILAKPHIVLDPVFAGHFGEGRFAVVESVPWVGGAEAIALDLGDWAARCAVYAMRGLPIHPERWANALAAAPLLIVGAKADFNATQWPRFRVDDGGLSERRGKHPTPDSDDPYEIGTAWRRRVASVPYPFEKEAYVEDQQAFTAWAQEQEKAMGIEWKRTDTGAYASDRDYLSSLAADSDECPIKAYLRCTKEVDALVSLTKPEKGLPKTVGMDCIHRFAVDPYATQTSRNGQGASRFIMSGPHWMRALIDPPEGEVLVELDFGSQEIFIAAALSGDANYMLGYETGDPYWTYAVLTGAIPASIGTPSEEQRGQEPWSTHASIRQSYKSTFLGIGFGMAAKSLARDLSRDTRREVTQDEAQGYIDGYNAAYPDYAEYRRMLREAYSRGGCGMMLADGWRMGPDCPVPNSYLNLPVQGHGAAILRKACRLLDEEKIMVVATMHDAVTIRCREEDADRVAASASDLMMDASHAILGVRGMRVGHPETVRHGEVWMHSGKARTAWKRIGKHIVK